MSLIMSETIEINIDEPNTVIQDKLDTIKTDNKKEKNKYKAMYKKLKKEQAKMLNIDFPQIAKQSIDDGAYVVDDDVDKDWVEYYEKERYKRQPINIRDGLLSIDGNGHLYVQGNKINTDNNHNVNRHVVKTMLKEIQERIQGQGEGDYHYVDLSLAHTIMTDALNPTQNRHKNAYVKKVRDHLTQGKEWDEFNKLEFEHGPETLYLTRKTRKRPAPSNPMIEAKIKREKELDQSKDLATRVVELEAENSLLRNRKLNPENRPEIPRTQVQHTVPEIESQLRYVNPVIDRARPGPAMPTHYQLYKSPALHQLNALFKKDKANYTKDLENSIFEPLWRTNYQLQQPNMLH